MAEGFKPENFKLLAELEARNFWFRVRNKIILWAIEKYSTSTQSFLEIGCGTGFVTQAIAKHFPDGRIVGTDYFLEGLRFSRHRSPSVEFIQMDARQIPFSGCFSAIGAFDVIEHIEEDETVLAQIHQALQPDGLVYITVPQHQWLWSAVDDYTYHVRRYSAEGLFNLLSKSGFEVLRSTSFVTLLLPLMLVARWLKKDADVKGYDYSAELDINPVLNRMLEWFLGIDAFLIRLGVNLPIGGSRLVIARKSG